MQNLIKEAVDSQSQSTGDKNKGLDELNRKSSESDLGMKEYSNTGTKAGM